MKRANIIAAGKRSLLKDNDLIVFVEFFSRRFPNESDNITSYVNEWANRFTWSDKDLRSRMDLESLSIYNKVLELHGD